MKNLITILLIAFSTSMGFAQEGNFIKADVGLGAAMTFGNLKSYGISASSEFKYFITNQISAGVRFEGDVLIGGSIDEASSNFSVGMSTRAATLLKGEYYLSESNTRPFVGLMAGRYVQANIGATSSGDASITAGKYFGFAPEIGLTIKNFRLSGMYHFIPGTDLVQLESGNSVEVSRNYLVLQMGFKIFQFNL